VNPTAVPDLSSDAWLLALGTMLALALVGRLWHRWQQDRADKQALSCRSLPFDSTLARWPGVPEADTDMQRLVGEVQDRLGMQLLAARTLARTGDDLPGPARLMHLDQQLAQALLSLRLMREAVRAEPAALGDGLHGLQAHFQPMLAERGIRLSWQVDEAAATLHLPARSRLHLMRLVQEALDNVVRHAEGAHAAEFELRLLEERSQRSLCLRISDDGRGKPEGRRAEATARGIALMERIASDLGAPLAIGPARPGWVVELTLKL